LYPSIGQLYAWTNAGQKKNLSEQNVGEIEQVVKKFIPFFFWVRLQNPVNRLTSSNLLKSC